jgi:hypothetical protein
MTMSPVLDVTIPSRHGPPIHHVLKLYDRRFGSSLRTDYDPRLVPHTQAHEVAFQSFVKRGMMAEFLGQLKEADEAEESPPLASRKFLDNTTNGCAKYEAARWRECNEHFRSETKAYKRLANLQGKSLPRMVASIRLVAVGDKFISAPANIPPQAAFYFEVRGILLERIDGYNLADMTTSSLAPPSDNLMKWGQIIQSAIDMAHEINRQGIIMQDCAPRNVVVDKQSQTPHIVDLAQCLFRGELTKLWQKWRRHEDDGWDPYVEYWKQVASWDNTGGIGAVMVHRVEKATGVKLDIKYPDCTAIISGIQAKKAAAAERRRALPMSGKSVNKI